MPDSAAPASTLDPASYDPAALHARYEAERQRRLRRDGNAPYRQLAGDLAHYLDDPHVESGFRRDPVRRDLDLQVLGGGFGGLVAAARLRQAGYDDLCIIEKGRRFRRHLVLEPLSRRGRRHREPHLTAAAGRDRP